MDYYTLEPLYPQCFDIDLANAILHYVALNPRSFLFPIAWGTTGSTVEEPKIFESLTNQFGQIEHNSIYRHIEWLVQAELVTVDRDEKNRVYVLEDITLQGLRYLSKMPELLKPLEEMDSRNTARYMTNN